MPAVLMRFRPGGVPPNVELVEKITKSTKA
jgi:hypothetical protein